ncbi:MAG TPA: alpha/beta hydrolase [Bryobacteraceae bacterium]|jgi:pimeloyl-ACP methyl ester carboxylesterase|nr:alpha/beta hydrolase [Bryobacteraceae bacterium]
MQMITIVFAALALAAPPSRSREVIRRDGVTVETIAEGRGPLIVMLPSLGRDSEEFDPVAERLASAGFRVLRPQPRGYGRSAGPMTNITLHDYAGDVAAVIRNENAGPAIIAGHAFGHFVAKMTAVDFPGLVRAVILIGAAEKHPKPEVQRSVAIATDPTQPEAERLKHLKIVFFAPGNDPTPWLKGFHAELRAAEVIARDATPQAEYYSAGKAPMLDIQGADDPYKPAASANELVEEFGAKRVSVVRIPHAAHAIIVEQPRAVADAIVKYARSLQK